MEIKVDFWFKYGVWQSERNFDSDFEINKLNLDEVYQNSMENK